MSNTDDATMAMPPPEEGDGGGSSDDGDEGRDRRQMIYIGLGVLVIGLLVGALVAILASGGDDGNGETASTESTSSTTLPPTTAVPATAAPTSPPTQGKPAPVVLTLNVNPNFVACYQTTSKDVTVSWTTQYANQTTLSVDGPGIYATYGPNGSQSLSIACEDTTHHYTVTAKGPGGQTTKSTSLKVQVIPGPPPPTT